MNDEATLVLSFDTELAWGAVENGLWQSRERRGVYDRVRTVIRDLLRTMEELQVPATWAIVGGLFDNPTTRQLDHLPLPFRNQLASALEKGRPTSFDGRDIVDLLSKHPQQELACHTYSHVRFTYPGLSASAIAQDLMRFRALSPDWVSSTRTLVFPRNEEAFHSILETHGFNVFRTRSPDLSRSHHRGCMPWVRRIIPPLAMVDAQPGLVRMSGSMFFNTGRRRLYRLPPIVARARLGLQRCISAEGVFHVWVHPFNFSESSGLLRGFRGFLRKAAALRDQGHLAILTMRGLAQKALSNANRAPSSGPKDD